MYDRQEKKQRRNCLNTPGSQKEDSVMSYGLRLYFLQYGKGGEGREIGESRGKKNQHKSESNIV